MSGRLASWFTIAIWLFFVPSFCLSGCIMHRQRDYLQEAGIVIHVVGEVSQSEAGDDAASKYVKAELTLNEVHNFVRLMKSKAIGGGFGPQSVKLSLYRDLVLSDTAFFPAFSPQNKCGRGVVKGTKGRYEVRYVYVLNTRKLYDLYVMLYLQ